MGRRVVEELVRLREKDPYLRGLVTWLGFKQTPVFSSGHRGPKAGLISPLQEQRAYHHLYFRLHLVFGLAAGGLSSPGVLVDSDGGALCFYPVRNETAGHRDHLRRLARRGTGFFSGVQLMGIGTVGLYLGRVYNEVRNRPRYLIASVIGFEDQIELPGRSAAPDPVPPRVESGEFPGAT